jgi:hypothetical protein
MCFIYIFNYINYYIRVLCGYEVFGLTLQVYTLKVVLCILYVCYIKLQITRTMNCNEIYYVTFVLYIYENTPEGTILFELILGINYYTLYNSFWYFCYYKRMRFYYYEFLINENKFCLKFIIL